MKNAYNKFKLIAFLLVVVLGASNLTGCIGCVGLLGCASLFEDGTYDIESDAPKSNSTFSDDKYAYSTLDPTTQTVYNELYQGIVNMEEEFTLSTEDETVLNNAVECIAADYGELFYVNGYSYSIGGFFSGYGIEISPEYTMSKEERDNTQAQIDAVVNEWLSEISMEASDYEKSKWVYETLISRVDYVPDAPNNQNIISVFLNGQTVCQGYSAAANYLFTKLGIQSFIVPGYAEGGPHAWNCVRLDGEYYYTDVTWGNSMYTNSNEEKKISYSTLNVTASDISRTHTIEAVFPMPECNSINDNYFYQEGCYFESFQPEKMGKVLHNGYVKGKDVSIKCANSETYDKMKTYFIDDTNFTDYCNGARTLQYTAFPEDRIIVFHFS
ncbi:MAG: hypothetical protein K5644_06040 [Lachnospiraceae bacterium]|nr:hypothetical protein [Lachnospiraceae bacterium]